MSWVDFNQIPTYARKYLVDRIIRMNSPDEK
jgi:hypothetical protein